MCNVFVYVCVPPSGKCSHGSTLDTSIMTEARGGINKETSSPCFSPHHYLHQQAVDLATAVSMILSLLLLPLPLQILLLLLLLLLVTQPSSHFPSHLPLFIRPFIKLIGIYFSPNLYLFFHPFISPSTPHSYPSNRLVKCTWPDSEMQLVMTTSAICWTCIQALLSPSSLTLRAP